MANMNRRQLLGASALTAAAVAAGPLRAAQARIDGPAAGTPDLSGKSILITGSSSGFGYLGAQHYARAGAKVIASMRNLPRPEADELLQSVADENLDIHVVEIDVLDDASVAEGVAEAERLAGGALDVLVNNAGIGLGTPVEMQDMQATRLIFDTNVYGYQRLARAVLPKMREKGSGLIFNTSSQLGRVIVPNFGLYSATKFAVEAMSEQMAYELAPHGVEVTIIQPGGFPTEIWENSNLYTQRMLEGADEERKAAYADLIAAAIRTGPGSTTDPMDVPRAIAEIAAMPAGQRPLRRAVHPTTRPQEPINEVSATVQAAMLGESPYGPWVKSVLS